MARLAQIDILRFIAVLLVLGRHMPPCPASENSILYVLSAVWRRGGWIGVDLFFVLSGFLVSGLIFREHDKTGSFNAGRFLIRRGFKIYPAFWVMIGATVLVQGADLQGAAAELLFVQNYFPGLWNHTWSLAVEEHFYFILAGLCAWLARGSHQNPFRCLPWVFLSVSIGCLLLRLLGSGDPYSNKTHLMASHLRLDGLFFGALLAWIFHRRQSESMAFSAFFRWPLMLSGVILLLPAFLFRLDQTPFIYTWGLILFYLGSGCLVVGSLGFRQPSGVVGKSMACTGEHSYSIYLWHMPVLAWGVVPHIQGFWIVSALAYLLGSLAFGIVMAKLIEVPALRLRDWLFPPSGRAIIDALWEQDQESAAP